MALDLGAQRARLGGRIEQAIATVLDHGRFILGPEVEVLEAELADFCGCRHAIACGSGTDALLLVLLAWGLKPGDAVFVPTYTFAATAEVVALLGATPVFVDIHPSEYTMAPQSLDGAIGLALAAGLRPAAVIPVDLFGHPADYAALEAVSAPHGLRVMADAAQSLGASSGDIRVGTQGEATATSFFPSKPLGCYGDGGAVFTDDDELAGAVRDLRVHGQDAERRSVRVGINGRLDTLQAAILSAKLQVFPAEILARRRTADRYSEGLAQVVQVPGLRAGVEGAWAQYSIQVDGRDEVAAALAAEGISTAVYYPEPLHLQPAFTRYPTAPGGLAVSEKLARRSLSLPIHPYLSTDDQDRVVDAVERAVGASGDGGRSVGGA